MKHSDQILLIALFLGSVCVSTTSTKAIQCTRLRGTICEISLLPPSNGSDKSAVEFPDLSKKTTLKVQEGKLASLTESMAQQLTVRILWMEGLGLESVFVAPNFEELHLRANQLTTLQTTSSTSSFALKLLDVRQNQLNDTSQLEPFVRLEKLLLDDNRLEQLNMNLFTKMPNLRVLSAAGNGLVRIVPQIGMLVLNELVTLSLAHNRLSSIEMDSWQLPSLQALLLSNNSLSELTGMDGFEQFYDLNKLELASNRWNCGWLQHALANVTVRSKGADGVALDADTKCSIEKVHDICCSFTPMAGQEEEQQQLFLQEISQVRNAVEQIDRRHEAFIRFQSDKLNELKKALQRQLEELQTFFSDQENQSEHDKALATATRLVQKEEQLREMQMKMTSTTGAIAHIEQERKQLLHFMVDMKNRLLRQAIETDSLWVQAYAEQANIERLFEERSESTV